ncbi:hypothetical protein SAMN04489761_3346 [Tenacibaculum sp. MAR_2009_124]|uniref:hypothetical protein n=1 Tax=Tenacibaculum sp. MAR_2009_124 TaxID=1250059 RepID=UPI00089C3192|nr:hypothetical protein [Tenacibaculum sp. MAR_2009_124]SEC56719.1 hypothetical protein SAMN04489761_3346 [Tenacibaculum sp. MAR_2009_124]
MMQDKFTYKQKKIGVFVLFVLVLLLGYKRIIRNTIIEANRYLKNKNIKKNEEGIRRSILNVQNEIYNLDDYLGEENFNEHQIQQEILEFITSKESNNNVTVTDIRPTHSYLVGNYSIISNSFTLKGRYNSLINLIYQIEKKFRKSKLNNARFFKKRNYKLKKEELFVELLFQNFKHDK